MFALCLLFFCVIMILYDNLTFSPDKTFECYVVNFIHERILLQT